MSKESDQAAISGCLATLLTLLIQFPLFCAILFGLLTACDAPTWTWVLFWIYVPIGLVLGCFRAIVDAVGKIQ